MSISVDAFLEHATKITAKTAYVLKILLILLPEYGLIVQCALTRYERGAYKKQCRIFACSLEKIVLAHLCIRVF